MSFATIDLQAMVAMKLLAASFDWRRGRLVLEITQAGREALAREDARYRSAIG